MARSYHSIESTVLASSILTTTASTPLPSICSILSTPKRHSLNRSIKRPFSSWRPPGGRIHRLSVDIVQEHSAQPRLSTSVLRLERSLWASPALRSAAPPAAPSSPSLAAECGSSSGPCPGRLSPYSLHRHLDQSGGFKPRLSTDSCHVCIPGPAFLLTVIYSEGVTGAACLKLNS